MQSDLGYISPYFITDPEHMTVDLPDPLILIHERKLASLQPLLPLLEKVVRIALENAVSVASILLLTEATMTEVPEPKESGAPVPDMEL